MLLSPHIVSDVEQIAAKIMMMQQGTIQHALTGTEYVQMMEGRVWLVMMSAEERVYYQNWAVISNVRATDDGMEVRVIANAKPFYSAWKATPTLEDAYLYLFHCLPGQAAR